MSRILPSGSILPSGLLDSDSERFDPFDFNYKNYGIKIGFILEVLDIDNPKNLSKSSVEYDVAVFEQNMDESSTVVNYRNCIAMESMGGIGDFFEFKRRGQTKTKKKNSKFAPDLQDGQMVLIMHVNGIAENSIIVGAIRHTSRKTKLTPEAGVAMAGEFNGLSVEVDKHGAMFVKFKGATDTEGEPLNKKVSGSYLQIEKDGSIEVGDGNKEKIRIDKTKKTISAQSESDMSLKTEANLKVEVKTQTSIKTSSLIASVSGSSRVESGSLDAIIDAALKIQAGNVDLKSDGPIKMTGQNIEIKGTQVIIGEQVSLGGPGGAPALIASTKFLGTGNLGAPVISSAIGPFSAKVKIT